MGGMKFPGASCSACGCYTTFLVFLPKASQEKPHFVHPRSGQACSGQPKSMYAVRLARSMPFWTQTTCFGDLFFKKQNAYTAGITFLAFFRQEDKHISELEYHVRKARGHNKVDWSMYRLKKVIFPSNRTESSLQPAALTPTPKSPASQIHTAINRRAFNKSKKTNPSYTMSEASLCPTTHLEYDFKLVGFSSSPNTRSCRFVSTETLLFR